MAERAAHLTDHVSPRLPVRQWVLSVPKRLRYLMQRDAYRQATLLELVYYLIFYYLTNLVI